LWKRLSTTKVFGVMCFKSLKAFNMAMVGKHSWKLVSNPDSLITHLLKAKYFPRVDYYGAIIDHNPNYVLRSSWSVKDVIRQGFQWSISMGERIPLWDHNWLRNSERILPRTQHYLEWPHITVSNLLVWTFGAFENIGTIRYEITSSNQLKQFVSEQDHSSLAGWIPKFYWTT